jgi:hypothetical protein
MDLLGSSLMHEETPDPGSAASTKGLSSLADFFFRTKGQEHCHVI